jgi:serine protease Do
MRESFEGGKRGSVEVGGSGVIISATGEVLTNHHVIENATEVRCLLFDGRAMDAKVIGSDKDTDLALVQLQLPDGTPPLAVAAVGESGKMTEGDYVMAMGAPWGLTRSISFGVIACARRFLPGSSEYSHWLQTDASICPGNSGGPLVNTAGEVVGINTQGSTSGGDMGFAVPSDVIRQLLPSLRKDGKMTWSWTGLQLQPLKDFNRNIYFDAAEGVMIGGTDPDSPARLAGFQPRDRLVKVNGQPVTVTTEEDLPAARRMLGLLPMDVAAKFEIVRGGTTMALELKPREKGRVEGESLDCPRWDFTVRAINQFANPDLYFHREKGVFVYGVKYPGNAAEVGLHPKDIIVSVDGKPVASLDDLRVIHKEAVAGVAKNHRTVLQVLRAGQSLQIILDFDRDYEKE